jgi:hypothetical protein
MRPSRFRLNHSHPLAQGLVFAGLGNNPGGGTLYDSSVFKHDGTLTNMEPASDWIYDSGINSYALAFDGSSNTVMVPHIARSTQALSASVWLRRASGVGVDGAQYYFSDWNYGDNERSWTIFTEASTSYLVRVLLSSGGVATYNYTYIEHATALADNDWHNITFTFCAGDFLMYLDGVANTIGGGWDYALNGTVNTLFESDNSNIYIGSANNVSAYAQADIASPMLWHRALSSSEIRSLADPSNVLLDGLIEPDSTRTTVIFNSPVAEEEPEETPRVTTLSRPSIRPARFRLNTSHSLAQGLVFAGLGNNPGGIHVRDSSDFGCDGNATNVTADDFWKIDGNLGRYITDYSNFATGYTRCFGNRISGYPFTLSCWVKPNSLDATRGLFQISDTTDIGKRFVLSISSTGKVATYINGGWDAFSDDVLVQGQWFHLCMRFTNDPNTEIFYINGQPQIDHGSTNTFYSTMDHYGFGAFTDSTINNYFDGQLADCMAWDRALSTEEIRSLADPSNILLDGLIEPDSTRTTVIFNSPVAEEEPEETPRVTTLSVPSVRPARFRLNTSHSLAQGLVFAGLGQHPGGGALYDSSRYRHDGTFNGGLNASSWVIEPELSRRSLEFNSVDGYVTTSVDSTAIGTKSFALSMWLRHRGTSLVGRSAFSNGTFNTVGALSPYWLDTTTFRIYGAATAVATIPDTSLTWSHYLIQRRAGVGVEMYVDGQSVSVADAGNWANTDINSANNFIIGGRWNTGGVPGYYYTGRVSDILLIADRYLSLSEIQSLADPSNVLLDGLIQPHTPYYYTAPVVTIETLRSWSDIFRSPLFKSNLFIR